MKTDEQIKKILSSIDYEATEFKCDLNGKYIKKLNEIYGVKL